jgi:predicted Rossmann-fold nucleotide-binding protein
MAEFIESTERLSELRPAVSIFGSARIKPDNPHYQLCVEIARLISDAGYAVISGGPGIMEAANKGAYEGASPSVGLNIELPHEQHGNPGRTSRCPSVISSRARWPSSNTPMPMWCCPAASARSMN